ncbi:MAG: DUF4160 domain-containing protein [Acidobacteriota bacterium]
MPTVLRIDGYRFVIYVFDHEPAHVHVKGATGEAIFLLNCPAGTPTLRKNFGFNLPELTRIRRKVQDNLSLLCSAWKDIHEA